MDGDADAAGEASVSKYGALESSFVVQGFEQSVLSTPFLDPQKGPR